MGPGGDGPLCLVYEETSEGLDDMEFSRYWLLSNEWSLHHSPCVANMVAAVAIAQSLHILVTGHDLPSDKLTHVITGKILIPNAARYRNGRWHPEDLTDPAPGQDAEWRRAIWKDAQDWLTQEDLA